MSVAILEAIKQKRERISQFGLSIVRNDVPAILRNFNQIKGRNYPRQQIYRLAGRDQKEFPRPGLLENLFDLYSASSFASRAKGELIIGEVNSWQQWREQFVPPEFTAVPVGDFWSTEDELNGLLSSVRRAYLAGDHAEVKVLLIKIRQTTEKLQWIAEIAASTQHQDRSAVWERSVEAGRW